MSTFTLTEAAANQIKKVMTDQDENAVLKTGVIAGGCSGFEYVMGVTTYDELEEDDIAIESNGVTIILDGVSAQFLEGTTLDYVEGIMGSSFQFNNPNAVSGCGCGESFSV